MKNYRFGMTNMVLSILGIALLSMAAASADMEVGYPFNLTDSSGREITIEGPVESVIALSTESLDTLRSLGAKSAVVGVSKYVLEDPILYPEFTSHPNVGGSFSPDIEAILSCHPDIIFTYCSSPKPSELDDLLERTDITVVRLDFNKISVYGDEVMKMGRIMGKEAEAEEYLDFFNSNVETIRDRVSSIPEENRPRVYMETDFGGGKTYSTIGAGHGHNELIEAAGGANIFSDIDYSQEIDPEEVLRRDPQIIIKYKYPSPSGIDMDITDISGLIEIRDEIMDRAELQNTSAVKAGEVYVITWDSTRGAARFYFCLGYLAELFHPELFENLNPRGTYQDYLSSYQGLDLDLSSEGVFAYPEART
ncbi:MAG: ABC transporter substrate-binding protein [Methanotrichaceae archaeon]|nr:ABC transporter substrate-binding protein [Methanotrichaceae archaeon]